MRAQYTVICEFLREGAHGTVDMLGLFDSVNAEALPTQHAGFSFVCQLIAESEDDLGNHRFELTVLDPKGKKVGAIQGNFALKALGPPWLGSARLNVRLVNLVFLTKGRYTFRLEVDDVEMASHPLSVNQVSAA